MARLLAGSCAPLTPRVDYNDEYIDVCYPYASSTSGVNQLWASAIVFPSMSSQSLECRVSAEVPRHILLQGMATATMMDLLGTIKVGVSVYPTIVN